MAMVFKKAYRQPSWLRSLLQPQQLFLLLTIWFVAGFAPIICIVHCQFLHGSHVGAIDHAHMHHAQPQIAETSQALICSMHMPASAPGIPPITALPPILHDALVAALNLTTPAILLIGLALYTSPAPAMCYGQPPTPPPRVRAR